jgi:integrase
MRARQRNLLGNGSSELRREVAPRSEPEHRDRNLHPLLACLADTGARLGEALALRLSDLDVARCAISIDKGSQ